MNIQNNIGRYLLISVAILLLATVTSSAQAENSLKNRFTVSADGQEIADSQTNLIWRRCSEGMRWDGATCVGVPISVTHEGALERADAQAISTGTSWRLPELKELHSLADETLGVPVTDFKAFPATPKQGMWCISRKTIVGLGSEYALGVSFVTGKIFEGLTIIRYHMRLVRTAL